MLSFKATDENGDDKTAELERFTQIIGLEAAAPARYSRILMLQLYGGAMSNQLNPFKVIAELDYLEGKGRRTHTKPAALFKHPPLKGLWHKHHLTDGLAGLAKNLRNGIGKDGLPWLKELVRQAQASGEERYLEPEHIAAIAHDAVQGNYERRAAADQLTGEWIIYAQHAGQNYYLSLGRHDTGDDFLRQQIDQVCVKEFPFLAALLT